MKPEHAVRLDRTLGRVVYPLHRFVFRASRGMLGGRFEGRPIVLVHTTGRRTGRPHAVLLLAYPESDAHVVVASNGGRADSPDWFANLRAQPRVRVQVGRRTFPAQAEVLDAQRRASCWPLLTAFYPGFAHYATLTDRELAVVRLTPAV